MRRFATPTLPITIQYSDKTIADDLQFDFVIVTFSNGNNIVEKTVPFSQVEGGKFSVELSQEETGSMEDGSVYEVELNIMIGDKRIPTDIKRGKVQRNLHNEVIMV